MNLDERFVPNDVELDLQQNQLLIITGPNMAGKSTYMRQVALIVLMAQIGSLVPAGSARIGVVDRIFTRVGASDNLAGGQNTTAMLLVTLVLASGCGQKPEPFKSSSKFYSELVDGTKTYQGGSIEIWRSKDDVPLVAILQIVDPAGNTPLLNDITL